MGRVGVKTCGAWVVVAGERRPWGGLAMHPRQKLRIAPPLPAHDVTAGGVTQLARLMDGIKGKCDDRPDSSYPKRWVRFVLS